MKLPHAVSGRIFIKKINAAAPDGVQDYGRIAAATAAEGSVAVNLQDKLGEGDQLFVFNETYNGGGMTDFASALCRIELPKPTLTVTARNQEYVYDEKVHGDVKADYSSSPAPTKTPASTTVPVKTPASAAASAKSGSPKTGDDSTAGLWAALIMTAAAGLILTSVLRKKS